MADIRIKDLANTATSAASDDYLAIDGSANGTRKILATNVAQNVTDVTFGSSGPSAKSSIAARAARQGLVFDGTSNGATVSVAAIGTSDFTASAWLNVGSFASPASIFGQSNGVIDLPDATTMRIYDGATSTQYNITIPAVTTGKTNLFTWTRSGTTVTGYVNGVAAGTVTCALSLTAFNYLGSINASNKLNGTISGPYIYNRALTAAEVVALYEAGVPAGSDYATPAATNTSLNTSAFTNTGYGFNAYPTFSGASATGFTAAAVSAATYAAGTGSTFNTTNGKNLLVSFTLTLTSGQAPTLTVAKAFNPDASANYTATAGTNSILIPMTRTDTGYTIRFLNTAATSYAVSNFSVVPAGLLLAPDAGQAGGGLTWYDTSGNAANITLPASGVSWNVPTSSKTATGWTFGGNLTVSGTGTSSVAGSLAINGATTNSVLNLKSSAGTPTLATLSNRNATQTWSLSVDAVSVDDKLLCFIESGSTRMALVPTSGNLLLGTTTDGGQKLQVAGNAYFDFGTNNPKQYINKSGDDPIFNQYKWSGSGSTYLAARIVTQGDGASPYGGKLLLQTSTAPAAVGSESYATALTLDSSQNATFAGTVRVNGQLNAANGTTYRWDTSGDVYARQVLSGAGGSDGVKLTQSGGVGIVAAIGSGGLSFRDDGNNPLLNLADATGDATFAGTVIPKASTGSAVFALDTAGQTVTINNGTTATPFGNANNFSGYFIVTDTSNTGHAAVFLTASGSLVLISQTGTNFTTGVGTASKTNVYLNSYIVTIQNNSGSNTNYNVTAIRTRQQQ